MIPSLATRHSSLAAALALAIALFAASATAQVMNDPTRPPSEHGMAEPEGGAEAGGPVLQSVMISREVKAAIINGAMVKLGEKYGNAVLVAVAENEVVLKTGDESQVLKLHPGVEKREAAPVAAKAAPHKSKPRRGATDSAPPGTAGR
jgi:MSHA biogenesis protein MshK